MRRRALRWQGAAHLVGAHLTLLHLLIAVHELDDGACLALAAAHVAFHAIAHLEAERLELLLKVGGRREALSEARAKRRGVQILADEDELARTRLVLRPRLRKLAIEDHMHGVVDKFGRRCVHDAVGATQVVAMRDDLAVAGMQRDTIGAPLGTHRA